MNLDLSKAEQIPCCLFLDVTCVSVAAADSGVAESVQSVNAGLQQDEQALLCHMASRLNMGHEGLLHPIVPHWVTHIRLRNSV